MTVRMRLGRRTGMSPYREGTGGWLNKLEEVSILIHYVHKKQTVPSSFQVAGTVVGRDR
jgi:hypothetical protein